MGYRITTKLVAGVGLCGGAAVAAVASTGAMAIYVGFNIGKLYALLAGHTPRSNTNLGFMNDAAVWAGGMAAIAGGLCAAIIAL